MQLPLMASLLSFPFSSIYFFIPPFINKKCQNLFHSNSSKSFCHLAKNISNNFTSSSFPPLNGAFFVLEPKVFDYIDGDTTQFEKEPLERLAADGELMAYRHDGFWQCMDTLRDKRRLQKTWEKGHAPWMTWEASA